MNMNYAKSFFGSIVCYLILKVLQLSGFILPSWGIWAKQKFFILTAYHELKRHHILTNLPLEQVNMRLLKIKQRAVLTNVSEITQWSLLKLDMNKLRSNGVDLEAIMGGANFSQRDLEFIAHEIVNVAPRSLNYGNSAMLTDIQRMLCQAFPGEKCPI